MPTLFWFLAYIHINSLEHTFLDEINRYAKISEKSSKIDLSNIDFPKLLSSELLHAGLKETLRLQMHNIAPRHLTEDSVITVDGREFLLKKGTFSFAPSTLVNWNPDIYEDPMLWKPERFLEKQVQEGVNTKYDKTKLKIPLLIWGAGLHIDLSKGISF